MPLSAVERQPLSLERMVQDVSEAARGADGGCGAVATFIGLVRATNLGRQVEHLDYEAYEPLAVRVFERIRQEAAAAWPGVVLGIHHRVGRLEIGETSVILAAAAPHRADAFRACRYAIERVKQVAPVWKHEHFAGGEAWIEGAVADIEDAAARQEAMAKACA